MKMNNFGEGYDMIENVKKISGIPITLENNFTGSIRGEILLFKENKEKYFPDFSNCRNGAVGILKQKDGKGCEYLNFIAYDLFGKDFSLEIEKLTWLANQGFEPVYYNIINNLENIISLRENTQNIRDTLEYDIDGLVIKGNTVNEEDLKRDRPEHQIAFKFSREYRDVILLDVEWSKKGKTLTPVAIFNPTELCGTTIQRASIHNMDIFNSFVKKGMMIGSTIRVFKAGEIIPQVLDVLE